MTTVKIYPLSNLSIMKYNKLFKVQVITQKWLWLKVALLTCVLQYTVQGQSYEWVKGITGKSSSHRSVKIAVDGIGNVYITGEFEGTIDFDPGVGIAFLRSNGYKDIFIAKYNSMGTFQWAKNIGGTDHDVSNDIVADNDGNIYITGYFTGADVDFDPGADTAPLSSNIGSLDAFVAKYSSEGAYQWAYGLGGTSRDIGLGLALDGKGYLAVTGFFVGTNVDFDPGSGTTLLNSNGTNTNDVRDLFITKYSVDGVFQWARGYGDENPEAGYGVAADSKGDWFVTGQDFLLKYEKNGVLLWERTSIGGSLSLGASSVALDGNDHAYVAFFNGYVKKYTNDGNLLWEKRLLTFARDVVVSRNGDIYATGNKGAATSYASDALIVKMNSRGDKLWEIAVGGRSRDEGNNAAIDQYDNVYITGGYRSIETDFDPGPGVASLTGDDNGIYMFMAKYSQATLSGLTIQGFSPQGGRADNLVVIHGTNFSPVKANNIVKFNGVVATVVNATSTALEVKVPAGITSGKISVTVGTQTVTSTQDFYLLPEVASFTPTKGAEGTIVTITGNDFSSTAADNVVKFNGTIAKVNKASATSLEVQVPTNATTGKISLTVNNRTITSQDDFTVSPKITDFSPTSGGEGSIVVIEGLNFGRTATNTQVRFNGLPTTITSFATKRLEVQVPAGVTTGKITVEVGDLVANSIQDFIVGPTGLPAFLSKGKLTLFPNPTSHYLYLKLEGKSVDKLIMTVYNVQGNSVLDIIQKMKHGQSKIDISSLSTGKYILKMQVGKEIISRSIWKQ